MFFSYGFIAGVTESCSWRKGEEGVVDDHEMLIEHKQRAQQALKWKISKTLACNS